jgi:hypothetical protein
MPVPTFVLCVGAQKAGTTWLQRYITSSAAAFRPLMKEFHVWNTIYSAWDEPPVQFEGAAREQCHRLHHRMVADPECYFDYFAEGLDRSGNRVACDVTPAYAGLPSEAFERIRRGMNARGIRVKVVFLMRDPVERCWSAVRMYRRKGLALPGVGATADDDEAVRLYCRTPHARQHGSYQRTVAALERAFPPADLYFGFYETMFAPDSIRELSAHLQLEPRPGFATRQYNVSDKLQPLSLKTRAIVADADEATVNFCAERFPATRTLWPTCGLVSLAESQPPDVDWRRQPRRTVQPPR